MEGKGKASGARHVPRWLWDQHRCEIEKLYVSPTRPRSIPQIAKHMQEKHNFIATEKQYKAQLNKWGTRKNMTLSDAATLLYLINTATSSNIIRAVYFNGRMKTRNDIMQYISKSTKLQSETDLLQHLPPPQSYSNQVSWKDAPSFLSADTRSRAAFEGPRNATDNPGALNSECSESMSSYAIVSQATSSESDDCRPVSEYTNQFSNAMSRVASEQRCQVYNVPRGSPGLSSAPTVINPSHVQNQVKWSDEDFTLPNDTSGSFDDLVLPMAFTTFDEPFMMVQPGLEQLNRYLSATPEAMEDRHVEPSANDLDSIITRMLGHQDASHEDELRSKSRHFLRLCSMALICDGQSQDERFGAQAAERAVDALSSAVQVYAVILQTTLDDSLTVLNNVVYLYSMYGQTRMATDLLERIKNFLSEAAVPAPDFVFDTLTFMTSIAEPGSASLPCYDVARLRAAVEMTSSIVGFPRLALAAKYNLAWALLEMGQSDEATKILMSIMPDCEEVFGPHHVQTVTCVSTLARAHLYTGRMVAGERLIDEVMGPRIEKAFSTSHPFYWEFKNRQALFMRFRFKNIDSEEGIKRRAESERLLLKVLEWRVDMLGPNNPQTQRTYRVLRNFFIQSAKYQEATNLAALLARGQPLQSSDSDEAIE